MSLLAVPPATPEITDATAVTVTQPAMAVFTCTAVARPRPSITWYRVELNGSRIILTDGSEEGISISDVNGSTDRTLVSTLRFDPSRPFFSSEYVCEATNPVASAETNVTLTVHGKGERI